VRNNSTYFLRTEETTLAEILKKNGYTTAGFVSAEPLNSIFGINQGFDYYNDEFTSLFKSFLGRVQPGHNFFSIGAALKTLMVKSDVYYPERKSAQTLKIARDWITKNSGFAKPFFIWIHLFDPHYPYEPPEPFNTMYKTPVTEDSPRDNQGKFISSQVDLYDGEISYVDTELGKFFDWMKSNKLWDNTLKVITADHGESFNQEFLYNHTKRLFDSIILVPLIIQFPENQISGLRIRQQVRLIDVTPTIIDILGANVDVNLDGITLLPLIKNPALENSDSFPKFAISETECSKKGSKQENFISVRSPDWKMISDELFTKCELYNIANDPKEAKNLCSVSAVDSIKKELVNMLM
jgi:arylsulfatase A-like enzyme